MFKLEFKINKYALASKILEAETKKPALFPFFKKTYEKIWDIYSNDPEFFLIQTNYASWGLQMIKLRADKGMLADTFFKSARIAEHVYQEIFKTKSFKKIERETKLYLKKIKSQWRKKELFIQNYIQNTLRIPTTEKTVYVYIFHPKLSEGKAYYKDNVILWGHEELWENYSLVYITHELLHVLLDGKCKDRIITHALIELATDNELRIRLNKNDAYFTKNGKHQGHDYQKKLVKRIYPEWKRFLKNNQSFLGFEKKLYG